jgi:hypothetical protein
LVALLDRLLSGSEREARGLAREIERRLHADFRYLDCYDDAAHALALYEPAASEEFELDEVALRPALRALRTELVGRGDTDESEASGS